MERVFSWSIAAALSLSAAAAGAQSAEDATPAAGAEPAVLPVASGGETAQPEADTAKGPGRVGIAEIIVTAEKREENIQDVPIAISAFSGDELAAKGIQDTQKLQLVTPGLVFDSIGNFSVIYLRGVGTDAFIPSADLSVATYVDGIYLPFAFSIARALGDVQRVEVLKGPQGTLFGRNSTGGAINITTRNPDDEFRASVEATASRFDERDFKFSLSGPLFFEGLSGSVSAIYNTKHEYYHFTADSAIQNFQNYLDKAAAGKLRWTIGDQFDATLGGFYFNSQGPNTVLFAQLNPTNLGKLLGVTSQPDYKISNNAPSFAFGLSNAEYLTLGYHPGPLDFKLLGSHQELYGQETTDFDGSNANVAVFGGGNDSLFSHDIRDRRSGQKNKVNTLEFQTLSNDKTWLSKWLTWIGGLYYYHATSAFEPVLISAAGLNDLSNINGQLPVPIDLSVLNPLLDLINAAPVPNDGAGVEVDGALKTKSYAAFGQFTVKPLDWLDITLGGRFTKEKRHVYDAHVDAVYTVDGGQTTQSLTLLQYPADNTQNSKFSPKVNVALHPLEHLMTYGSYQEGFKSGSFNIVNITTPPSLIKPETTKTAELGLKSDWFNSRLRVDGAVYYTRIKDLQSQFLSLLAGGVVSFENAQKASVKGGELDVTWAITPALILNLGGNLMDGVYDKFTGARGYDPQTRAFKQSNDFSGNTIVRNPKFTGSAGLNYSVAAPGGVLEFGGDAYYNSGFYYDPGHTAHQDSYYVLNARTSYLFERFNLRLTFFADNLNDGKRYLFQFPNDFGTVGKLAPPRTLGGRLNWQF